MSQRTFRAARPVLPGASLVALLVLSACQDRMAPQLDNTGNAETEFTLTAEGARAAKTAHMVAMRKLPLISQRRVPGVNFSSAAPPKHNSPFDLSYFGGPMVKGATTYNVYVNCPGPALDCWGSGGLNPRNFLDDLNGSDFIRILNEYLGVDAKGRFPTGTPLRITAGLSAPNHASLDDIYNILFDAVAVKRGASGYNTIYHVFLPQGTSMCIIEGECYSPDNPDSWVFCAFHGSVNFEGGQHVLFTVQPYQMINGCTVPGQTPHGVIDATASTLSHEAFELITDPDLDAWFNGLLGLEMADICSSFATNVNVNLHDYFIQSMYSNKLQTCTNGLL